DISHSTAPVPVTPPESFWVTLARVSLRSPSRSAYGSSFHDVTSNSPVRVVIRPPRCVRHACIPGRHGPHANATDVTHLQGSPQVGDSAWENCPARDLRPARREPCPRGNDEAARDRPRRPWSSPPSCRT